MGVKLISREPVVGLLCITHHFNKNDHIIRVFNWHMSPQSNRRDPNNKPLLKDLGDPLTQK